MGNWLRKVADILLKAADELTKRNISAEKEYAIDATSFPMEGSGEVARVHCLMQLGAGLPAQTLLTDPHTAESACNLRVKKGNLYLADRAYGHARSLAYMRKHEADFIFRISPQQIRLYSDEECRNKLVIRDFLKENRFSLSCWCWFEDRAWPLRLVGEPLPPEKQAEAEERARRNAARRQKQVKPETLLYAKWCFLATSLTTPPCEDILEKYKERWQIELLFKRGKSVLKFRKLRFSKGAYQTAAVKLWLFAVKLCSVSVSEFLHAFPNPVSLYSLFVLANAVLS